MCLCYPGFPVLYVSFQHNIGPLSVCVIFCCDVQWVQLTQSLFGMLISTIRQTLGTWWRLGTSYWEIPWFILRLSSNTSWRTLRRLQIALQDSRCDKVFERLLLTFISWGLAGQTKSKQWGLQPNWWRIWRPLWIFSSLVWSENTLQHVYIQISLKACTAHPKSCARSDNNSGLADETTYQS